jgi:hypothetical protein
MPFLAYLQRGRNYCIPQVKVFEKGLVVIPRHLRPAEYTIHCECLICGHVYSRKVRRVTERNPPCPIKACREAQAKAQAERMAANIENIIAEQRPPGVVGSNVAKAIDHTNEIVARDYGFSDVRDAKREGDTSVPRLPTHQQARVDGFWGNKPKHNPALANQMHLLGQRAMAGSFAPREKTIVDHALSPEHGPGLKPNIKIIAG